MKNLLIAILMMVSFVTLAQTQSEPKYKVNKQGELVEVKSITDTATKVADPVYKKVGNRTFYKGPKGGIYEWKVSKKTGKKYKAYLPKDN